MLNTRSNFVIKINWEKKFCILCLKTVIVTNRRGINKPKATAANIDFPLYKYMRAQSNKYYYSQWKKSFMNKSMLFSILSFLKSSV